MRNRNGKTVRFRDRIEIQRDVSPDGIIEEQWKTYIPEVSCIVNTVSGQSTYRGIQLEEAISTLIETHEIEGLLPNMRVIYEGEVLEIKYIKLWRAGTARQKQWLFCNEVDA